MFNDGTEKQKAYPVLIVLIFCWPCFTKIGHCLHYELPHNSAMFAIWISVPMLNLSLNLLLKNNLKLIFRIW